MTATFESVLSGLASPGLFSWRGRPDRDLVGEATVAGWHALSLDTRQVTSFEQFYDEVATAWALPESFGRNLVSEFGGLL